MPRTPGGKKPLCNHVGFAKKKGMNTPRALLFAAALLAAAFLAGCTPSVLPESDDFGPVGSFSLTERGGKTVSDADLRGKVWVASFVFTRCTGPCPQVTGTMARLQAELADQPDVRLVTFTVDPDHDRPKELTEYADRYNADKERWLFLTGPEKELYRLLHEGFKVTAYQNKGEERKPGREVEHSTRLVVVDKRGRMRGYFSGLADPERAGDPESQREFEKGLDKLKAKVAEAAKEAP